MCTSPHLIVSLCKCYIIIVLQDTWNNVVVKGPCDSGRGDSTDSAGQQEALSLVEGHVPEQLGEDGVSVNSEGHGVTVLAHCIHGDAGVTACVLGLRRRQGERLVCNKMFYFLDSGSRQR